MDYEHQFSTLAAIAAYQKSTTLIPVVGNRKTPPDSGAPLMKNKNDARSIIAGLPHQQHQNHQWRFLTALRGC